MVEWRKGAEKRKRESRPGAIDAGCVCLSSPELQKYFLFELKGYRQIKDFNMVQLFLVRNYIYLEDLNLLIRNHPVLMIFIVFNGIVRLNKLKMTF